MRRSYCIMAYKILQPVYQYDQSLTVNKHVFHFNHQNVIYRFPHQAEHIILVYYNIHYPGAYEQYKACFIHSP